MAMNKAEKKLLEDAYVQGALRWTQPIEPDLLPPGYLPGTSSGGFIQGWDYNQYSQNVFPAWSDSISHGSETYTTNWKIRAGSQGRRRLYSTKALALKALRASLEYKTAVELRKIDKLLAEEASK